LVLIVTATSTRTIASQRAEPNSIAFVHVAVIDATGTPIKPDQTVVISGDRIAAVASSATTPIPKGTRTIDATGKFLIPGLWDAHVHTRLEGIDHLRLLIANGITSARNMSGPWPYLPEILGWREQITKGARVGPRLLTAGPILDGPGSGRSSTNVIINNPDDARQAVRRVKREGADFVKVYNLLSRESFFAIADEAKALDLPFVGHVPFSIGADEASDAGLRSIEHLDGILWTSSTQEAEIRQRVKDWRPSGPVPYPVSVKLLADSFSIAKLRALAERLKQNHTSVVPTLAVYWSRLESPDVDQLRYVPAAYAEQWKQLQSQTQTTAQDARLQFEQCLTVVRELHRAGVTILAGTDAASHVPGFSLHDELSLLVQAGLSPMDALEAATHNPARAFNLTDQGTIEKGMRADLVLLDASPLDNIDNVRKIRAVVARGRMFERRELDAMLADIQRAASQWVGTPTR
jgi:imidazolonepropionase-like amidohydrolase